MVRMSHRTNRDPDAAAERQAIEDEGSERRCQVEAKEANTKPGPLVHLAATKELVLRHVSPAGVRLCRELLCSCCKTPLLAVERALAWSVELARRTGRQVAVVCGDCQDKIVERREVVMYVSRDNPEIRSLLAMHEAEKN